MQDSFGRRFSYLRLSVTDACNFRCVYCLPNGYKKQAGAQANLNRSEIFNLVSAFAEMGTVKVRLTGGEPTLRPDFLQIARDIRDIPGIEKVAVSTNGFRLQELASSFLEAGISAVNVSVDTLDPAQFQKITGTDQLQNVVQGIETALTAGFSEVKVNAVLLKGLNEDALQAFLKWIRHKPIVVRFIELMPTGQSKDFFRDRHISSSEIAKRFEDLGWKLQQRSLTGGPAKEFTHTEYQGRLGIIAPYAKDFCSTCNRLRVTSQGGLRLCLFGEGNHDLRDLLQSASQKQELQLRVQNVLKKKEISHYLAEGRYGNNNTFSSMGG